MYTKNKLDYNKIFILILFVPFLASCGHALIGQGTIELRDHNCNPITDKKINVNSIESAGYLFKSGHLSKDTYTTDQRGQVVFDIEKTSDKMAIFLQDVNGEKEGSSKWNWYTTTSSNDEILFFFNTSGPAQLTPYKVDLLSSSSKNPIVIAYPYKKDTCNNNYPELDKYNLLKTNAEEEARIVAKKAAKVAAEKARIDAIKIVIPKFKIEAYGAIHSFFREGRIVYEIPENSSLIKNKSLIRGEDQMTGGTFGFIYSMSEIPVLKKSSNLYAYLSNPDDGIIDPSTGEAVEGKFVSDYDANKTGRVMLMHIKDDWQLTPGKWAFQVKYKDSVLLEHAFIVE